MKLCIVIDTNVLTIILLLVEFMQYEIFASYCGWLLKLFRTKELIPEF